MNRLAGIILAVVGLIVAVLSVAKVVPGLGSTGAGLIVLGLLVLGLSFVKNPDAENAERMSTASTIVNIFFSPGETFQNLRRHPRWLVAAIVIALCSAVFTNLFLYRLTPERVTNFAIDKTLEMPIMNDEARKQVEAGRAEAIEANKNPVLKTGQAVSTFEWNVVRYTLYALIFFLFALAMGGKINFWQGFSVAVYAALPPAVIHSVLSSIILFLKDPVDIHPILGQGNLVQDNLSFLFSPSTSPALYAFAAHFSLLWFYWVWLIATGLKNAGEKITGSIAWTISIALFLPLLVFGVAFSYLFSGFIS